MPDLSVPIPILKVDEVTPGLTVFEKPIEVRCAAVTFPDGTAFDPSKLGKAEFFIYKQQSASAMIEIWDADEKLWVAESSVELANLKNPKPLIFKKEDTSFPWQGLLVAAGQKDKNGDDQFTKATPDYPQYFFRGYFASPFLFGIGLEFQKDLDNSKIPETLRQAFRTHGVLLSSNITVSVETQGNKWLITDKDNNKKYSIRKEESRLNIYTDTNNGDLSKGLSAPSSAVRFISLLDAIRAGIRVKEDETPETATEVQLFLRNDRRQLIGSVEIKNVGGMAQIAIAKWDAGPGPVSKIHFNTDGSIEIVSCEPNTAQSASIHLHSSGDLDIRPAPERITRINNTLVVSDNAGNVTLQCTGEIALRATKINIISDHIEAERIFYQPADLAGNPVGGKRWLS